MIGEEGGDKFSYRGRDLSERKEVAPGLGQAGRTSSIRLRGCP